MACEQLTRLGDVIELEDVKREPISSRDRKDRKGSYPYYGAQGIVDYLDDYTYEGDYLLVAEDGENLRSRKNPIANAASGKFRVNNHAHVIAESEKCNLVFLRHLLNMTDISAYVTGSTQPKLSQSNLCAMKLPLPSMAEQNAIANVLSLFDRKIELNNQLNDYLLDLLKSSAKNLYLKHEKNIQEKLPSGWRWVSIGEIADMVCRGIAPKYSLESDEIILGQTCIRNNLVLTENGRSHAPKKLTDKWLKKYDLLINSTGVGSLGRTAQVWFEPSKLVVDSHVTIVRATDKKNALYLGSWAFEHERYIESLHTGSTGQTELPRDRVKAIRVVLPDAGTLDEFNAIAEPSVKMIVANQEGNKRLIEIRDTLLPKLMSGEIDVSKVDLMQLTNNHLADY